MKNIQKDLSQRVFIRPGDIQAVFGISRSTAYRLIKEGDFPQTVKISQRCTGWHIETLKKYFKCTKR